MQATAETSASARRAMVDNQVRTYDVTDQKVLAAFDTVPRERYLPAAMADLAYSDAALTVPTPSGALHAFLAPMVLARMFQALALEPDDAALVVAALPGYAAAIAAELCGQVVALGPDGSAPVAASSATAGTPMPAVGPLAAGWRPAAPYDAILIAGGVETNLDALLDQLKSGGRLVAIQTAAHEGTRRSGKVVRYDRIGRDISSRVVFDATAPVLDEFRLEPSFVF